MGPDSKLLSDIVSRAQKTYDDSGRAELRRLEIEINCLGSEFKWKLSADFVRAFLGDQIGR